MSAFSYLFSLLNEPEGTLWTSWPRRRKGQLRPLSGAAHAARVLRRGGQKWWQLPLSIISEAFFLFSLNCSNFINC